MKCSKCGKDIANDSIFCEYCGLQIKRTQKKVDIRWVLLPAMLLTHISLGLWYIQIPNSPYSKISGIGIIFLIPCLLFMITLWYKFKKEINISFVLIMGVFLLSHCGMYIELDSNWYKYDKHYTHLNYEINLVFYELTLSIDGDGYQGYREPDNNIEKRLEKYEKLISKDLEKRGADDDDIYTNSWTETYFSYNDNWLVFWGGAIIALFLYFVYAYIAYKMNWIF